MDEARLLNADGYTRWWNPKEFTAPGLFGYTPGIMGSSGTVFQTTLNPYKVFSDELSTDQDYMVGPGGRTIFTAAEKTNSRRYLLQFPLADDNPVVVFNYAVDACWAEPEEPGTIFPPEANQIEPYRISLTDKGSSAYFKNLTTLGGDLYFELGVFKHFGSENPSWALDELDKVILESSTLFEDPIILTTDDIDSSSGDGVYFDVLIPDVHPTGVDGQRILVHAQMSNLNYNQGFFTPAPDKPLSAFQIFSVDILPAPPVAPTPEGFYADIGRNADGKLNGIKLDWDDVPTAKEYVVYWSTDPYQISPPPSMSVAPDGYVTESSYSYSVTGCELNGQWFFDVAARTCAGDEQTEGDPTSKALVDFAGWEPYGEGGNAWRRRQNPIRNKFIAAVSSNLGVDGSGSLILSLQGAPPGIAGRTIAYCVTPQLPSMPDATTCYFEFAHRRQANLPSEYSYSVCTSPTIPDPLIIVEDFPSNLVVTDYNIDMVDMNEQYVSGDKMNYHEDYQADPGTFLGGLFRRYIEYPAEDGDPADGWSGTASSFAVSRYELPNVLASGHVFAGVCFGGREEGGYQYIMPPEFPIVLDEFALVIY
jgi:hypothetical protein